MAPPSDYCGPATPGSPFELPGLGSSDFARHYFRNHGCFLFLWVLRWFTSPGSLDHPMNSDERNRCSHRLGFPIRKSPDHSLLAATRSLSQLTTSFIAYLCQGIHTHALSSLTIKSTINTKCRFLILLRLFQRLSNNNMATTGTALLVVSNARQSYSIFKDQFPEIKKSGVRSQESEDLTAGCSLITSPSFLWWAWVESNYRPHPYQGCALAD